MIIKKDEPLNKHTTFGIGGIAEIFFIPESKDEALRKISEWQNANVKYYILGNGSNLLISDKPITRPVISLSRAFKELTIKGDGHVHAGASTDIRKMISASCKAGFFAPVELLTIPATIGGAVVMNAGRTSFGVSISDQLVIVEVFNGKDVVNFTKEQCQFGHRDSFFLKNRNHIIIGAVFKFEHETPDYIQKKREESLEAGKMKCYRTMKSAGSTFKTCDFRIMHHIRGIKIGDAQLSKTTNCIVNHGNAKFWQVLLLSQIAKLFHRFLRKDIGLEYEIWR